MWIVSRKIVCSRSARFLLTALVAASGDWDPCRSCTALAPISCEQLMDWTLWAVTVTSSAWCVCVYFFPSSWIINSIVPGFIIILPRIENFVRTLNSPKWGSYFFDSLEVFGVYSEVLLIQGHKHKNSTDWNEDAASMLDDNELLEPLGQTQQDEIFFNRLDAELEKINHFYRTKEAEYVARAMRLEKQLLALFEVREALARQSLKMRTFSFTKSQDRNTEPHSGEWIAYLWKNVSRNVTPQPFLL